MNEHAGDSRLADYVLGRIPGEIRDSLRRHVVHVTHVVLQAGDAPPEAECVREAGRALAVERRGNGAHRLRGGDLFRIEVRGGGELRYLRMERRERLPEALRGSLAADRDWAGVVERVIVDDDAVPQAAVHE